MTPAARIPLSQRLPWWFGWLLLTIYFLVPAREAFDQSLDKSNYGTYAHFFAHGFKWGRDVIPMTGPFGFILYGHTYSGELFDARFFSDLALKAVFAGLLLHLFRRAGGTWLRWLWLAAVVLLLPTVDDLFHDFAILVATLVILANLENINRRVLVATLLLGALALFKGTHLITTAACFSAVVLLAALERRWLTLVFLAGLYVASILGWWLLAGQDLTALPVYWQGTLELSSGYNASMGLDPLLIHGVVGFVLAGGLALVFAWVASVSAREKRQVIALLLLAGFSFIKWKHGFLRADGHVFIFYTAVGVLCPTVCLAGLSALFGSPAALAPAARRHLGVALGTGVAGLATLASADFWLWRVYRIAADVPDAMVRNLRFVGDRRKFQAELDRELEHNRREAQAPQIQNEIEGDTVDFFGFEEGVLLLNHLNYHPRPMGGGSFNVLTRWLQDRNEAFVRDPQRAPHWQVVKMQTLDDRLPAADDSLTLRAILDCYTPVLVERDLLLMKRRSALRDPTAPVLLSTQRVRSGDTLAVPDPGPDRLVLASIKAPLSVGGTLRALVLRPPVLRATVVSQRRPQGAHFVLKPTMIRRPLILSPLLQDNADLVALFGREPGDLVRSLRLDADPGFDDGGFVVTFFAAPRPAPPEDGDIGEIRTHHQFPLANRAPIEVVTENTGIRELNKEPITLVHAPGMIRWRLQPGDQQVIFRFGLMPQAYLDTGRTDGVEFIVEVLPGGGEPLPLFRRQLRPLTEPGDRGMQRARVYFPPGLPPDSILRIRTDPGPAGNGAWDQSYIARLQIKQGAPDPRQYVGFNVSPLPPGFPAETLTEMDGHAVRMVHPPLTLSFPVAAGAQRVIAGFGVLPGAYQGQNHTDGVDFIFRWRTPDGRTGELERRRLDPLQQSADRGIQVAEIKLPPLPAGAVLDVSTGPGPNGNLSWDWAVLQTLIIE